MSAQGSLNSQQFESLPESDRNPHYVGKHRHPEQRGSMPPPVKVPEPYHTQDVATATHNIATHVMA